MANSFEAGPPLSHPSPKSHIERRIAKADLDKRIADEPLRRPRIGKLPIPPAPVGEGIALDEPVAEEADDEGEGLAVMPAQVIIRREPPIRK